MEIDDALTPFPPFRISPPEFWMTSDHIAGLIAFIRCFPKVEVVEISLQKDRERYRPSFVHRPSKAVVAYYQAMEAVASDIRDQLKKCKGLPHLRYVSAHRPGRLVHDAWTLAPEAAVGDLSRSVWKSYEAHEAYGLWLKEEKEQNQQEHKKLQRWQGKRRRAMGEDFDVGDLEDTWYDDLYVL